MDKFIDGFVITYVQVSITFQLIHLLLPAKFKTILKAFAVIIVAIACVFFIKDFSSLDGYSISLFVAFSVMNLITVFSTKFNLRNK